MQKSQIYLVLAVNAIVLAGIAIVLSPVASIQTAAVVGGAFLVSLVAPILITNATAKKHVGDLYEKDVALKKLQEELSAVKSKFAAVTTIDELTGCANRRHYVELLGQHTAMSERGSYEFTVAVTQIDQFTDIIDKQGLGRGNEVLQLFSRIVKAALREVDVIARLEADKFGLILSGCSEEDALQIINRISQLISQIQVNEQDDVKITSSGGITSYHGTETAEDLISHAEQALDFAIEQGRDRVAGYNYVDPNAESPA